MLWVMAELAIVATDLAEVLGTAIGLNLLFGLPLLWGCCVTALDTLILLFFQRFGHRFMETVVFFLMSTICVCFIIELFISKPSAYGIVTGFVPTLPAGSLATATGILGATIMPHNIYL
jgi:manganese transport protein